MSFAWFANKINWVELQFSLGIIILVVTMLYMFNYAYGRVIVTLRRDRRLRPSLNESDLRKIRISKLENQKEEEPVKKEKKKKPLEEKPASPKSQETPRVASTPRKWMPIKTVEELLSWTEDKSSLVEKPVKLVRRLHPIPSGGSRLTVVHDMAGNYLEDAYMDGYYSRERNEQEWAWIYRLSQFSLLEKFVYFSHHLVSIPPMGWMDACHRGGCLVYGSFLTEWKEGEVACDFLFQTRERSVELANQLERIRAFFGFDGWFINIENRVLDVGNLKSFLSTLSSLCDEVIWYDSVLADGTLSWQNCVNTKNETFLSIASRGVLTNYCYGEEDLKSSAKFAAIYEKKTIFNGIDVWGRNQFGGGGMKCDLAVDLIQSVFLEASTIPTVDIALFAPAWTLEKAAEKNFAKWRTIEESFWNCLYVACGIGCASFEVSGRAFYTDFCSGGGRAVFHFGKKQLGVAQWMDLRRQNSQPAPSPKDQGVRGTFELKMNEDFAFCGNQHLVLRGRIVPLALFLPLFHFEFKLTKAYYANDSLVIKVPVLFLESSVNFYLEILDEKTLKKTKLVLLTRGDPVSPFDLPVSLVESFGRWEMHTWRLHRAGLRNRRVVSFGVRARATEWVDARVGGVCIFEEDEGEAKCGVVLVEAKREGDLVRVVWQCSQHGEKCDECWAFLCVYWDDEFAQFGFKRGTTLLLGARECARVTVESVTNNWHAKRVCVECV